MAVNTKFISILNWHTQISEENQYNVNEMKQQKRRVKFN